MQRVFVKCWNVQTAVIHTALPLWSSCNLTLIQFSKETLSPPAEPEVPLLKSSASGWRTIWLFPSKLHLVLMCFQYSVTTESLIYGNMSRKMWRRRQEMNRAAGNITTAWKCCCICCLSLSNCAVELCCPLQGGTQHDSTYYTYVWACHI